MRYLALSFFAIGVFAAAAPAQNIVANPSFEEPDIGGGFQAVGPGGAIGPWTAGGNGVDFINDFWVADDGGQSIDMNRDAAGSLSQILATTPGQLYRITFAMAGNAGGFDDKTMRVDWGGVPAGNFIFDQTNQTFADMGWEDHFLDVLAIGSSTELAFVSTTGAMNGTQGFTAFYGPALDNVSVVAIPEPATAILLMIGATALVRRRPSRA